MTKNQTPLPSIYAIPYFFLLLVGLLFCFLAMPFMLVLRLYQGFCEWLAKDFQNLLIVNFSVVSRFVDDKFIKPRNK